jgi:formylmethanofuran dehydrogenase subunit E
MSTTALFQDEHIQVRNAANWTRRAAMRCSRCGGLMVREESIDLPAQRCVQCGDFIDPVILQNRHRFAGG